MADLPGINTDDSLVLNFGKEVEYPGEGGTSTSFVRGCVTTRLENWPIRRLKLAHQ